MWGCRDQLIWIFLFVINGGWEIPINLHKKVDAHSDRNIHPWIFWNARAWNDHQPEISLMRKIFKIKVTHALRSRFLRTRSIGEHSPSMATVISSRGMVWDNVVVVSANMAQMLVGSRQFWMIVAYFVFNLAEKACFYTKINWLIEFQNWENHKFCIYRICITVDEVTITMSFGIAYSNSILS